MMEDTVKYGTVFDASVNIIYAIRPTSKLTNYNRLATSICNAMRALTCNFT